MVTFSTDASTLSSLTHIDSDTTRERLVALLPKTASGSTNMCKGLNQGLQVPYYLYKYNFFLNVYNILMCEYMLFVMPMFSVSKT